MKLKTKKMFKKSISLITAMMVYSSSMVTSFAQVSENDTPKPGTIHGEIAEAYDPTKEESYLKKLRELEKTLKGEELAKAKAALKEEAYMYLDEISQTPLVSNLNSRTGTKVTITTKSATYDHYYIQTIGSTWTQFITSREMKDSRGYHAYCLNSTKKSPNGHVMTSAGRMDDAVYRILKNGWPNKSFTGDAVVDRIITQGAVWSYVDSGEFKVNNVEAYINKQKSAEMLNHMKNLYNTGVNGTGTQNVSAKLSSSNLTAKLSGDNFYTDYITIVGSGDIKESKFKLTLSSSNNNIKIVDANGNVITNGSTPVKEIAIGEKFRVVIPKSVGYSGNLTIKANGTIKHSVPMKYTQSVSTIQNVVVLEDVLESVSAGSANVSWSSKGSIKIVKTNADKSKKLQGAVFNLAKDGKTVATLTTDVNGEAIAKDLPLGVYTLQEKTAPTGYKLDTTVHTVTLDKEATLVCTMTNSESTGKVIIKKVNADSTSGELLSGAVFKITGTSVTNKAVSVNITTSDKQSEVSLPLGSYEIEEVTAPNGFVKNTTPTSFKIEKNGQTLSMTIKNTPIKGNIVVEKVDSSDTSIKLSGAVFGIYDEKGTLIEKATTNANGLVTFSNYKMGTYKIKELSAPTGYVKSNTEATVQIKENDKTIKVQYKNTKSEGNVEFSKTDFATGKVIPGATIEIKGISENNKDISKTFVSSANGNKFSLPVGKYEITEKIAPEGYVLSTETATFEIKSNGDIVKAQMKNKMIEGSIKIVKIDSETSEKLSDAEFALTDKNGKVIQKGTTDENGSLTFSNVKYGEYYIQETKSPANYITNSDAVKVTISKNGEVKTITVKNTKADKYGELEFTKTDVSGGKLIPGAHINIKGIDKKNSDINIDFISGDTPTKIKLIEGKYEITEKIAPEGYVLSTETSTFEIKENGEVVKASLKNEQIKGSIEILKVDGDNESKKLENVEFTLYDSTDKEVAIAVTNKDGVARFENVVYGQYTIKETKAPEGYELDSKAISVKIETKGQVVKKTVINTLKQGILKFYKIDAFTKKGLAGVTVTVQGISESNENIKETFKTTAEGNTIKLPFGRYEITEISSLESYDMTAAKPTFTLGPKNQEVGVKLENNKIVGSIEINKVDDNNKPLAGAEFTLYDENGKALLTAISDSNGVARFLGVEYGKYTVKETKAPVGYSLSKDVIDVNIKSTGDVVKATVKNTLLQGTVNFEKIDKTTKAPLDNAVIKIEGKSVNGETINKEFKSSVNGNKITLPHGTYKLYEVSSPEGYVKSDEVINFEINEKETNVNIALENEKITSSIEILKVDSKNIELVLQGAEFTLYDKDKKEIAKATTNEKGIVRFENLEFGKYFVKETANPKGYTGLAETIEVNVINNNEVIKKTVSNILIEGQIEFSKIDKDTKALLKGAIIKVVGKDIHDREVNVEFESSTEKNKMTLPYGEYELSEVKAPEGYVLTDKVEKFEIKNTTDLKQISLENEKIVGSVQILKVDSENEETVLEDAEFTIYDSEMKEIGKSTTDKKGVLKFENLNYGKYTIKETKAPEGYVLNEEAIEIEITEKDQVIEKTVTNKKIKGSVVIEKIDYETKELLEGAKMKLFGVDKHNKDYVKEFTTTNTAMAFELEYGKYKLVEVEAPTSYELSKEEVEIEITTDGEEKKVEFVNKQIVGSIQITKVAARIIQTKLEGAEFVLMDKDGKEIQKGISDKKGLVLFENLKYGEYSVKETKAPVGYKLDETVYKVVIDEQGEVEKLTIKNHTILAQTGANFTIGGLLILGGVFVGAALLLLRKKED